MGELTDREREILTFERRTWTVPGAKEAQIRYRWGLTGARYYQIVNQLIDRPEALAAEPVVVNRLRRLRDRRARARSIARRAS